MSFVWLWNRGFFSLRLNNSNPRFFTDTKFWLKNSKDRKRLGQFCVRCQNVTWKYGFLWKFQQICYKLKDFSKLNPKIYFKVLELILLRCRKTAKNPSHLNDFVSPILLLWKIRALAKNWFVRVRSAIDRTDSICLNISQQSYYFLKPSSWTVWLFYLNFLLRGMELCIEPVSNCKVSLKCRTKSFWKVVNQEEIIVWRYWKW